MSCVCPSYSHRWKCVSVFSCGSLVRIAALGRTAVLLLARIVVKGSLPLLVKVADEGLELFGDFTWELQVVEEKPAGRAVTVWGFYNFIYYLFIFGGAGSLLPCERLGARASRCNGFSCCGSWALGSGSVVLAHGLSCSEAWGIFPDQALNPCLLHWWVDSLPLSHQGSPGLDFFLLYSDSSFPILFKDILSLPEALSLRTEWVQLKILESEDWYHF